MDRLSADAMRLPGVEVRVAERCGSTNTELLSPANKLPLPCLLAAECQTGGRGRRGRRWYSTPGQAITFSFACHVRRPARELAALSLVAGVAAAGALRRLGARQVALKWPNDLVAHEAKLGGILVETRGHGCGALAVIGIGINYLSDPQLERRLRRRVASLEELLSPLPSRNAVIRAIGAALLRELAAFERDGLEALRRDWLALHAHAGQRLRVRLADGRTVSGIADGLAADGGLQLRTRSGLRDIRSGRVVSARAAAAPRAEAA